MHIMISIIDINDSVRWDNIVKSFVQYDVYYLSGYVKAFQIHGDGTPQLLYYCEDDLKAIYVYMKRNTFIDGLYDCITPYGYGGVLFEGNTSNDNLISFWNAYLKQMQDLNIVDNFVRYHPVLENAIPMKSISEVIDLGKTVAMDLTSPEIIWENIVSKNRNMIRKAEKYGVEIHHSHDYSLFKDFIRIYNSTMEKDNADEYYFFSENFYRSIHRDLDGHYEMFYATFNGKIISMAIMLFANNQMHYHLSGSECMYRNLAPSNLLLYKAALWGYEQGYKIFHLGGGLGSGDDNLYKFKAAFNRNSCYQFSIAKHIYDPNKYDELVACRKAQDPAFNSDSDFFPLYRS